MRHHRSEQVTLLSQCIPSDLSERPLCQGRTCLSFQSVSHRSFWLWFLLRLFQPLASLSGFGADVSTYDQTFPSA